MNPDDMTDEQASAALGAMIDGHIARLENKDDHDAFRDATEFALEWLRGPDHVYALLLMMRMSRNLDAAMERLSNVHGILASIEMGIVPPRRITDACNEVSQILEDYDPQEQVADEESADEDG